ncbi:MAG: hypothetical protein A2X93_05180 [Deltaproteobacteria bacterium GWC2_56_8]|nr:MAG: hypothetical protein A2X99_05045 [Deltaproteobacteria bacterium GWB2_55_19]OGP37850.1 MAG: hypothetical protein A2X93_05180 [Deltaproteobacteria bacterium GWC2_56_8]HAO93270.1 stage 0 sporulation protein [Deltaproteobacteria bacterium]
MAMIVGIRFKKACKVYDFEANGIELIPNDMVIVEVEKGLGMGTVVNRPREVDEAALGRQLKKVVRKADTVDMERNGFNTEREDEAFRICREKIAQYKLPMKLIRVEYLFDSSKAIFYFTSETRVDFRELVKDLAGGFHTRIEMRQIGVRDEAKMIGGLGPCGRELCCSGFLSDFEPVTIKMAKDQNLALNPVKISGICGRLMCCLSYEHGMYQGEKREKRERERAAAEIAGEAPPEAVKDKPDRDRGRGRGRDREKPAGAEAGHACGGCGKHGPEKQPNESRTDRPPRPERQGRPERTGRPDKSAGADKPGRPERQDRGERPARPERPPRPDRQDRPRRDNAGRADKPQEARPASETGPGPSRQDAQASQGAPDRVEGNDKGRSGDPEERP